MAFPKVNDVVTVQLKSNGNGKITKTKSKEESQVVAVYSSNQVQVESGDVWRVVPDGAHRWLAVG